MRFGAVVPTPTFPEVCWTTNWLVPTVNPLVPSEEVALRDRTMLPSDEVRPVSFRYMEPVPVRSVPLTQRLEATVDVPDVPRTSMNPAKVLVAVVLVAVM